MKQIYILLIFLQVIVQVVSKARQEQIYHQRNQNYFISSQNSLIIESDSGNESEIRSIDYKFIEDAFIINEFDNGKIISLAFLSSLEFWRTTNICVCQLLQTDSLNFISCIDRMFISHTNYTLQPLKNQKKYKIILSQRALEKCSNIYVDYENQLIACCFIKEALKIYLLNLKLQSTTIWKDESEKNLDDCSKQILNTNVQSLLVFYKCKNWMVINITKNQINVILNSEIGNLQSPIFKEIQNLSEIFLCQNQLYLVEDANYYVFLITSNVVKFLYNSFTTINIKKIVLSSYCDVNYIILQSNAQKVPIVQFNRDKKEVIINTQSEVYEINSFLLIKNENEIQLVMCQFFNQTYKVHSSQLQFIQPNWKIGNVSIKAPNLLFQIDESLNKAIVYKYNYLPKFIKPTKNFVIEIFLFNVFTNIEDEMKINQLIYADSPYTQIKMHNIILENKCQQFTSVQLQKESIGFPLDLELQFQDKKIITSIEDEQDFDSYLPFPFSIIKENIIQILWIDLSNSISQNLMVYLTQEKFQVIYLENPIQVYQMSLKDLQIFNFQNIFILLNIKLKQLKRQLISFSQINEEVYYFEQDIAYATKCLNFLIIHFTDETYCIFQVHAFKTMYIGQRFKEFGIPLFYFQKNNQLLIQFEKVLVCQLNNIYNIFPIENIEIIHISFQLKDFLITVINKDLNKISIYYIDENSLIQLKEFFVYEATFFRPLIYQSSVNYISIASITNSNKSILTLKTGNNISIVSIKYCGNYNFTLQNGMLIYYNENQAIRVYSLDYYNLTINIIPSLKNYFSNQKISIQTKFQQQDQQYFQQKTLNIITMNNCKQIINKKYIVYLEGDSEIIISNIFDGPIQKITSSDENLLAIDGPFHNKIKLNNCNSSFRSNHYCFIVYSQLLKSTIQYFHFKCIPQFEYCLIQNYGNMKIIIVLYYIYDSKMVILIKQDSAYFFHLFQIDHQKFLIYETSYQQIIELKSLMEKQIVQNKNIMYFAQNQYMKQYIINFYENQYQAYIVKEKILDICSIQNKNDLYLLLQINPTKTNKYELECILISFANKQKQIIQSFIFGNEFLDFMIENNLQSIDYRVCKFNFLFCHASHQYLSFTILFISDFTQKGSMSSEIQVDIYNSQIKKSSFKVVKVYRNPIQGSLNLHYSDSSYMVLRSEKNLYFYNKTTNLSFYDYFCLTENEILFLQMINTTHYLINQNYSEQYLAEIGFKIKINENATPTQTQEKILLIAQNDISKSEVQIIFIEKQNQNEKTIQNFVIRFLLLCFGLFLIFFVKRQIIKQKQVKIDQNNEQ